MSLLHACIMYIFNVLCLCSDLEVLDLNGFKNEVPRIFHNKALKNRRNEEGIQNCRQKTKTEENIW
jgi:hypothetical protein